MGTLSSYLMLTIVTGVIPVECVHMAELREFKVEFITDLKSESVDFTTEAISIVPVASQKSNISNLYTTPRSLS